jgi:hypothetical protein
LVTLFLLFLLIKLFFPKEKFGRKGWKEKVGRKVWTVSFEGRLSRPVHCVQQFTLFLNISFDQTFLFKRKVWLLRKPLYVF